ncbi:MAG TPA: hypothetical protein VH186_22205 [Chloroflexia bacterium]|nr:hypothetical protein [Chloroflexia bacterium]
MTDDHANQPPAGNGPINTGGCWQDMEAATGGIRTGGQAGLFRNKSSL